MSILLSAGMPASNSRYLPPADQWQPTVIDADYFQLPAAHNKKISGTRTASHSGFTAAELGFGLGERFIAVAEAWLLDRDSVGNPNINVAANAAISTDTNSEHCCGKLHYIAVTDRPLRKQALAEAIDKQLAPSGLASRLAVKLLEQLPPRLRGWHRLTFDQMEGNDDHNGNFHSRITLDLIYDDPSRALGQLTGNIDCWHLENILPNSEPKQLAPEFSHAAASAIAKHCPKHQPCRVFAPPAVHKELASDLSSRGYQSQGSHHYLTVQKYAAERKNEIHQNQQSATPLLAKESTAKRVAIIGAGLAGSAAALALARAHCSVTVFDSEKHIAAGTSGNPIAALQGRYHRKSDHLGRWAQAGWLAAERELDWLKQNGTAADAEACGSLHLLQSDDKAAQLAEQLQLPTEVGQWLSASAASEKLGGAIQQPALWQPRAMRIAPASLCIARLTAAGADVRLDTPINELSYEPHANSGKWHINGHDPFDAVVLATGADTQSWLPWAGLQLARGQLTAIAAPKNEPPHCIVGYGGQLWPVHNGQRWFGSTADREPLHSKLRDIDHATNIERLQTALGNPLSTLSKELTPIAGNAGIRSKTVDHLPLIGAIPDSTNDDFAQTFPGLFLTAGHGARGIANSAIGAELLAAQITGTPLPMGADMAQMIAPLRALQRWRKKAGLSPLAVKPLKTLKNNDNAKQRITLTRNSA